MKEFFLVLGGPGAGKNFYITTHISSRAEIVDLDELKLKLGTNEAISNLKQILESKFAEGIPIIAHPSIGKNVTANINKLKLAKQFNYKTTLIFISNTSKQALKNIEKRVLGGGHNIPSDKVKSDYKIIDQSFELTKKQGSKFIDEVRVIDTPVSKQESFNTFFTTKRKQLIIESDMLDVSIKNIDKSKNKLMTLLDEPVKITEKTDGVKVTVVRNKESISPDWKNNWIVAYKGNVIHPEDFVGMDSDTEKQSSSTSIGVSQFKKIFNVLEKAQQNPNISKISENTELFFEFLMRKPTLTRKYSRYHELILIATSPITYKESFGRLTTEPQSFDTTKREDFAEILGVQTPRVLFKGKLSDLVNSTNPDEVITELKAKFLPMESVFGGLMEGVVLEFSNGELLKILQSDQHDKKVRSDVKSLHAPNDSEKYYRSIKELAEMALDNINHTGNIKTDLASLSKWVFTNNNSIALFSDLDRNKTAINAKDDVFLTAKMLLLRRLPGNNNALFLGRFSPLTIAHYNIINQSIKQYDNVCVNIVKAKSDDRNPFPVEVQKDMLDKCFGSKIEITTSETGNLIRVLQKPSKVINVVLAGTDRFADYQNQLNLSAPDVKIVEIPRIDDVSGTVVRAALKANDYNSFKKNTPVQIWEMFDELRKFV